MRKKYMGIMVGVNTVIADNPQLTCETEQGVNPVRIIADSRLRIPLEAEVLKSQEKAPTILLTTQYADDSKRSRLRRMGTEILVVRDFDGQTDLNDAMEKLGRKGIDSILLEGGATLHFSALEADIVDKVMMYIAPVIIGGSSAKTSVDGEGIRHLSDAFHLRDMTAQKIDRDLLVEGYI